MDAAFYYDRLYAFRSRLLAKGYDVRLAQAGVEGESGAPVLIQLPRSSLGWNVVVAVPDVHLGDGRGGDVFLDGTATNALRLLATLRALYDFVKSDPSRTTALQLGDWYDVWRTLGHDTTSSRYSGIDGASVYQQILSVDKQLGLAHLIGNHDASFTHALPDRRVGDGARFRMGFGLARSSGRVFAMHGHQADRIEGEPSAPFDQVAVWLGALAGSFVSSEFRDLSELIDKRGAEGALVWLGSLAAEAAVAQLPGGLALVKSWFVDLLGKAREDVPPTPRPPLAAPADGQSWYARFVKREDASRLVKIASAAAEKMYGASAAPLELLIVGHSHKACVSWAPHPRTHRPVVIVDAGSWVYGQAQILFAAGNTVGVYDVVPAGTAYRG